MLSEVIKNYVTCRKGCSLRLLESLAMWGLATKAEIEDCSGKRRFKKIRMELVDGSFVESDCFLDEEVLQSIRIINVYIGLARQNRAPENIRVEG